MLLNLLLNGVDAVMTARNGERTLSVSTAPAGDGAVEVAIRDNGVGLPDSPADVFAPFFSTKPHGLGMGLSISRSIIEAHGGRLCGDAQRRPRQHLQLHPAGAQRPARHPGAPRPNGVAHVS